MKKIFLALSLAAIYAFYVIFSKSSDYLYAGSLATPEKFQTANNQAAGTSIGQNNTPPTPNTPSNPATPQETAKASPAKIYKDGEFTGDSVDAYYGYVQVKTTIQNDKIIGVQFLNYPNDRRTSAEINTGAMPTLISEAIKTQSSQVDIVSGATQTSEGFMKSLASALVRAKN